MNMAKPDIDYAFYTLLLQYRDPATDKALVPLVDVHRLADWYEMPREDVIEKFREWIAFGDD
jgi:hypothetical protein